MKCAEAALETMIGQEFQANEGQQRQHERQQRTVDRAQKRGRRTNAIGHTPPAGFARLFGVHRPILHRQSGNSLTPVIEMLLYNTSKY